MYPPNQNKVLARPRSSLSTDETRLKNSPEKRQKPSAVVLSLTALSLFLFVISAGAIALLVIVGRNFSRTPVNSNRTLFPGVKDTPKTVPEQSGFLLKPKLVFRPHEIIHSVLENKSDSDLLENGNQMSTVGAKIVSKVLDLLTFRLPRELRPKHYDLYLYPNLTNKTFTGNVSIQLEVVSPISYIPVHSKKLKVENKGFFKTIDGGKTIPISVAQSFKYEPYEYWVTEFENELEVGNYTLQLDFNGSLANGIVGFYQSSYYDSRSGKTRWIATSKFEPTYARQAFPCFDEPGMKARLKVTLVRPSSESYIALSNMEVEKNTPEGAITKVTFQESFAMSTYVACFIVGDFGFEEMIVQPPKDLGKPFSMRAYATPDQSSKVNFALETGVKITKYFIEYFDFRYPLPKLDLIAIPDFPSGAMEHWGLVTFRETSMLYDPLTSSTANKERVASVVSHELSHMWFGNLVTMKWWNDLWLNEGFASYITYKGVDAAHPTWKTIERFTTETLHGVMKLDATLASHPIVQTVENPDQITEIFDSITYSKGASVIRMMEDFVGSEKFQQSVRKYIKEYQFGNADTDDLLKEMESSDPNIDVKFVMETWTRQMGLPVVNVDKVSDTEYRLKQKRFLANSDDEKKEENESPFHYKWCIPVTYVSSENSATVQRKMFRNDDGEVTITIPEGAKWLKLNHHQVGYYRVNYQEENWNKLVAALSDNSKVLGAVDRAHLLNDAFALASAEQLSYKTALDLTKYLTSEDEYTPWSVASTELAFLKNILTNTDAYDSFMKYGRTLITNIYSSIGWTVGDNHLENLLRVTVLSTACWLEVPDCVNEVSKRFNDWIADTSKSPHPDIRSIVYSQGMKYAGNQNNWNNMWNLYKNEQDANEKVKLMSALSMIRHPEILRKFVDMAWEEENVRGQDYFSCLQNIAANPVGQPIVWDYVRENWERIVKRFSLNDRVLGRMIPSITSRFSSSVKLDEILAFFKKYPEAGAGTAARKQAIVNVENNIKWLKNNKDSVSDWLKNQKFI